MTIYYECYNRWVLSVRATDEGTLPQIEVERHREGNTFEQNIRVPKVDRQETKIFQDLTEGIELGKISEDLMPML